MALVNNKTKHNRTHSQLEHVSGLVEHVTFHSDESGFCVLRVKVRGHRDHTTVVGTLPQVKAGEWLEAEGRWAIDRNYGQQFKAEMLRTTAPNTLDGMEKYLGSGLIKGIGPVFAKRLVKCFGQEVLNVIEAKPQRLLEVDGIGPIRHNKITTAWAEQRMVRDIMVFMHNHGVSTSRAFRIYKAYGNEAIETVSHNPYRLAHDIRGIGFKMADKIAESLGITKESDLRARAGIEYVLQTLTNDGHCGYPRKELVKAAIKILEISEAICERAVDYLLQEERVIQHSRDNDADLIYLVGLDRAEDNLASHLAELCKASHPCPDIEIEKAIKWVEQRVGLKLADQQREAIRIAVQNKVMVITGGPGVGKTTLVNAIVKIMRAKKLRVALAAPTGRAAKRMMETTSLQAKTIHRLLAFDPATSAFKHNADNPLEGDIFIIDETSMMDLLLAHQLIRAIPKHAALILVGDVDQLPSVGPGCVLRDIIESGLIPVCRLTQVFRQAAQSAIITNAHKVNKGQIPVFPKGKVQSPDQTDFYFVHAEEPEKAVSLVINLTCKAIPDRFGFNCFDDIQVLSPMQRGLLGCRNLNAALQENLNPEGPSVQRYGWTFRIGDKVMQTVNNYDKDVFNGDIGRIVKLDDIDQELTIQFDDRQVTYEFNELDEIMLSYATTVHKSQGSEYPVVVMPIHSQHYVLLQRNLLYTAITRGRKLVVLVGTQKAVAIAVRRMDSRRRVTLLKERLKQFNMS
ncbi:MAG TPA: ATP-dependent RecD-like DNA helicase [Sedimentisphaerales bacterium]|nr:ATP-dependent RecD-like DNA helicase [Sedimentisphaerales bacterium]